MGSPTPEDAPISLLPYSTQWPELFASEAQVLRAALSPWLVAEVEHVGSTAISGLLAKPVIDIMAPVRDLLSSRRAIAAAESVGYCYYPYKPKEMHWLCKPSPAARTHHLHLVPWRSALWFERLAFRDALRNNASLAQQYLLWPSGHRDADRSLYLSHWCHSHHRRRLQAQGEADL